MLVVWGYLVTMCMFTFGDAQLVEDIKLFDIVDLAKAGVTETTGFHKNSKAYEFTDKTGSLLGNANASATFAKVAFLVDKFSVKAYLKATNSTGGTIVFLSRGKESGVAFNVVFKWSEPNLKVSSEFDNGDTLTCNFDDYKMKAISKNEWLHLTVHVYVLEWLIRCEIVTENGRRFFRFAGREGSGAIPKFPSDGRLRLAQQLLTGSEQLRDISERFVGKLQDVIISFGDPNCTITIVEKKATASPPQRCPTTIPTTTKVNPTIKTKTTPAQEHSCLDGNNGIRNDGDRWNEGKWVSCVCNKRRTYCLKSVKQCLYQGKSYAEGEIWDLNNCNECKCTDGFTSCKSTLREFKKDGCALTCNDLNSGTCKKKGEGCYCPGDQVLLHGECVSRAACPCTDKGKTYAAGKTYVDQNGYYCICSGGKFNCY